VCAFHCLSRCPHRLALSLCTGDSVYLDDGSTRLYYTQLCECEAACDTKSETCVGYVDNRQAEPQYCVLKSSTNTRSEPEKDFYSATVSPPPSPPSSSTTSSFCPEGGTYACYTHGTCSTPALMPSSTACYRSVDDASTWAYLGVGFCSSYQSEGQQFHSTIYNNAPCMGTHIVEAPYGRTYGYHKTIYRPLSGHYDPSLGEWCPEPATCESCCGHDASLCSGDPPVYTGSNPDNCLSPLTSEYEEMSNSGSCYACCVCE